MSVTLHVSKANLKNYILKNPYEIEVLIKDLFDYSWYWRIFLKFYHVDRAQATNLKVGGGGG